MEAIRIPGTTNSKCGQTVKVGKRWDGQRPAINYLLRDFRRWLIDEKIQQSRQFNSKTARLRTVNSTKIWWTEKLLQTPIDDYRKFAVWRILAPYLINIRKCSDDDATNIIRNWLDRCRNLRQLDFTANYVIRYNINSAKRNGYASISLEKLKIENQYLYKVVAS
jgi:hypothetical protein